MLLLNSLPDHRRPLDPADAALFTPAAMARVENFLNYRPDHQPTPLRALARLAGELAVESILLKDESSRLGLGSFKALGGSYAVICLVLEEASKQLGRPVDISELHSVEVREIAARLTFACATDGNHGRSVAAGARLVGATTVIFVHAGVSEERIAAIEALGATMMRVPGNYDDSVAEAERVCAQRGWVVVSDTACAGYERIPGLVMQGYTALLNEAAREMPAPPTHVFMQAGVGGLAAAVAAYFETTLGDNRPALIVVEPERAACLFASARAGYSLKIAHGEPTIMAMLECYEPSLVAWRILSRIADAFMTVSEDDAANAMHRLAFPAPDDPAIVAGESGGAGVAGLIAAAGDVQMRKALQLNAKSRIFVINTEGATDVARYQTIVGRKPADVLGCAA